MTDVWPHTQAHILISTSLLGAPPPSPRTPTPASALMIDITECCMTFAQSRPSTGRQEEEEKGMENRQMSGRGCGDLVLLMCRGLKVPHYTHSLIFS